MTNPESSNRLTCPHCPKYKTKRYKGEEGLADHIRTVHPEPLPDDDEMTDSEFWREYRKQTRAAKSERGEINRTSAEDEFQTAKQLASEYGITLRKLDPTHYQLIGPDNSLINIYPGNQRLYIDPNRPKPPYQKLPDQWTLLDVVKAAAGVEA